MPAFFRTLSFFSKLYWSLVFVVIVVFLASGVSAYMSVYDTLMREKRIDFLKLTVQSSNELSHVFDHGRLIARLISTQDDVRNFFSDKKGSADEILKKISHYNIEGNFSAIYLMDTSGKAIVSTDETFVGRDFSFRNYFKSAIEGKSFVDSAVGVVSRRMGYYFSFPIYSKDGNTITGVAVAKMEPEEVGKVIIESGLDPVKDLMLTNDNGVILYSKDENRLFKSLTVLGEERAKIERDTRFVGREIRPLSYDEAAEVIYAYKSARIIDIYDELDSEREIQAIAKVGSYPFFLVTEVERDIFNSGVVTSILPVVINTVGGILLSIALIWFVVSRMARPIEQIRSYTVRKAADEREGKLEIRTGDELEEISLAVNHLVRKVEGKKIEERRERLK